MAKRKSKVDQARYQYPLPIHPIDTLPTLRLVNPVSYLRWLVCYWQSSSALSERINVQAVKGGANSTHFLVEGESQMKYLWSNGFFGTGQLSRSEPSWKARSSLLLDKEHQTRSLEEATRERRQQRQLFKQERARLELELLQLRQKGCSAEEESQLLEVQRASLRTLKEQLDKVIDKTRPTLALDRLQDLRPSSTEPLFSLEKLELMPVEALFLTLAIPVISMKPAEVTSALIHHCSSYDQIEKFINHYIAYHHYRSHGWCARSGIKFGTDYLLYKRGPPFQHAEYAIMVLDSGDSHDYTWYSTAARVAGAARKTLVLCYVRRLCDESHIIELWNNGDIEAILEHYQVGEVLYRRWVPGKNRD